MSASGSSADTAFRVADRIHVPGPWDVFGERARRYEIHLNGSVVELTRGPIVVEGYGVRLLRPREDKTGTGFQASTDLSEAGIRAVVDDAEAVARHSVFPAKKAALPPASHSAVPRPEIVDHALWSRPMETLQTFVDALIAGFEGRKDETLSFGSVRASLTETSIANSNGLRVAYPHTVIEYEAAVKAYGGPEGPPPGEYWVNDTARRADPGSLRGAVDRWCRYAQDVRRAAPPPTGELPVILPTDVLSSILPLGLVGRFTGTARLREVAVNPDDKVAASSMSLYDDGRFPWATGSAPVDDEGTPQRRRTLIEGGLAKELLYDSLHGAAFSVPTTGNGFRASPFGFRDGRRFARAPNPGVSTLTIDPGDGGSEKELLEAAGDGIWVQQLGWAIPDPLSGAFGGELRIGYRIRGGKLAEPIRGGTIGGLVIAPAGTHSLLADIAAIGSEQTLCDQVASPPVLVRPLVVAGE
jgi:TldD protein